MSTVWLAAMSTVMLADCCVVFASGVLDGPAGGAEGGLVSTQLPSLRVALLSKLAALGRMHPGLW